MDKIRIVTTVILSGGTLLAWSAIAGMVIKTLVSDQ